MLILNVFGNTAIGCGDLVTVNLPEKDHSAGSQKGKHRFYRGVHLIQTLKHEFNIATKKHTMAMTLLKDSVEERLKPSPADGFIEIKPKKSGKIFNEGQMYSGTPDYDE